MVWLISAVAVVAAFWLWILSRKSLPFWKMVDRYPQEAWAFILASPHFHFEKSKGQDVIGPFVFVTPDGRTVTLYIDAEHIERVQREFVDVVSMKSGVAR